MTGGLDEVEDGIDRLVGVIEVCSVVEPGVVHQGSTNVEVVDTSGQGVQTDDDDVHAVLVDGIVGDGLKVLLLLAGVESRAGNLDPCSVGSGNAKGVDTDSSYLIDSGGVQEGSVASFEGRAALATQLLTQSPLIRSAITANLGPPDGIVSLLLLKSSAKISAISLEGLPFDEAGRPGKGEVVLIAVVCVGNGVDGEGALAVVVREAS